MKKLFSIILFIQISVPIIYAQDDYMPFVKEGKTWRFPVEFIHMFSHDMTCTISGDTIIETTEYKKVFAKGVRTSETIGDIIIVPGESISNTEDDEVYFGAIREDDKKVYFIPAGRTDLFLLYDFGMAVGESRCVKIYNMGGKYDIGAGIRMTFHDDYDGAWYDGLKDYSYKLESVKVIDISNVKRRCFRFSGDISFIWIEGIGNSQGFPYSYNISMPSIYIPQKSGLSCIENGVRIYGLDDYLHLNDSDISENDKLPRYGAYDFKLDGICYKIISEEEVSVSYEDLYDNYYSGGLEIPEEINYDGTLYKVTSIGDGAFYFCDVDSVSLPKSIRDIGCFAFAFCRKLKSLVIPRNIENFGKRCFEGCLLSRIEIEDLEQWLKVCFPTVMNFESMLIPYDLYFNNKILTHIQIPSGIKDIPDGAFEGCKSIVSVDIPNSVKSIGKKAFYLCNIIEVSIGCGLEEIEHTALNWERLNKVTINTMEPPVVRNPYTYSINATLYVPSGCGERYRKADFWKNFLNIAEMEGTGIENVTIKPVSQEKLFDLQGRRLKSAPQRGVYIRNGKKVVVR